MAKVKVTHKNLTGEEATVAPKREPVPPGQYQALIVGAAEGATRHTPPLLKVSCQFQILHGLGDDGQGHDETYSGRRVYQDFIVEDDPSMPDLSEQRRYELRMLLDATSVPFDDDGFDPDHLKEKVVVITVRHREGNKTDDEGNKMVFTNVVKIDSGEKIGDDELV